MARTNQKNMIEECCAGGVKDKFSLAYGTYQHHRPGVCSLSGRLILEGNQCVELETANNLVDGSPTLLISVETLNMIEQVRGQLRLEANFSNIKEVSKQFPHLFDMKPRVIETGEKS